MTGHNIPDNYIPTMDQVYSFMRLNPRTSRSMIDRVEREQLCSCAAPDGAPHFDTCHLKNAGKKP